MEKCHPMRRGIKQRQLGTTNEGMIDEAYGRSIGLGTPVINPSARILAKFFHQLRPKFALILRGY
jgi:hypothetical protein